MTSAMKGETQSIIMKRRSTGMLLADNELRVLAFTNLIILEFNTSWMYAISGGHDISIGMEQRGWLVLIRDFSTFSQSSRRRAMCLGY